MVPTIRKKGTCGLSVTTFFHQVLNYYYLTVYIMFKPKMSLWDLPKTEEEASGTFQKLKRKLFAAVVYFRFIRLG